MEGGVVKEKGIRGKYLEKYQGIMKKDSHIRVIQHEKSYHEGANDERSSILAKVRRMVKSTPPNVDAVYINGTELVKWLLQRNERYRKNPGGL